MLYWKVKPGWHNWLARETFNLKAVSSSLTSGVFLAVSFSFFVIFYFWIVQEVERSILHIF